MARIGASLSNFLSNHVEIGVFRKCDIIDNDNTIFRILKWTIFDSKTLVYAFTDSDKDKFWPIITILLIKSVDNSFNLWIDNLIDRTLRCPFSIKDKIKRCLLVSLIIILNMFKRHLSSIWDNIVLNSFMYFNLSITVRIVFSKITDNGRGSVILFNVFAFGAENHAIRKAIIKKPKVITIFINHLQKEVWEFWHVSAILIKIVTNKKLCRKTILIKLFFNAAIAPACITSICEE